MRSNNKILIVYDYWGASKAQIISTFKHVAKHDVPQGKFPYYVESIHELDGETNSSHHIQVRYEGRPFIVAREDFEESNQIVHRFLRDTHLITHDICRDSTNQFD